MDEAIIIVAIITTVGMMVTVQLMQHNWFKRKNWELQAIFTKKKYNFDLKKLEKQLGFNVKGGSNVQQNTSNAPNLGSLTSLLPLLKNLDPDQLQGILEALTGDSDVPEGVLEQIIRMLPPEIIQNLVSGFTKGAQEQQPEKKDIIFEG